MERAGLNGKQTAQMLGWSESFVSMLLNGKRNASEVDIVAFLGCVEGRGEEHRSGCWRCAGSRTPPGWLQPPGSRLPKQLVTLIDQENQQHPGTQVRHG